jgi:5'-phosphate synthase pdxT subunit
VTIGILGLQGGSAPHARRFAALGVATRRVLYPADLEGLAGLVLPGGESSTMLKTCPAGLWEALPAFAARHPLWGVCAGCILLARHVTHPDQRSLGLLDIDVVRNAYGAQNESFVAPLRVALEPPVTIAGVFIRAPVISRVGADVRGRARRGADPVMVQAGRHLATTFHPELTDAPDLHRHFLRLAGLPPGDRA